MVKPKVNPGEVGQEVDGVAAESKGDIVSAAQVEAQRSSVDALLAKAAAVAAADVTPPESAVEVQKPAEVLAAEALEGIGEGESRTPERVVAAAATPAQPWRADRFATAKQPWRGGGRHNSSDGGIALSLIEGFCIGAVVSGALLVALGTALPFLGIVAAIVGIGAITAVLYSIAKTVSRKG